MKKKNNEEVKEHEEVIQTVLFIFFTEIFLKS